MPIDASRIYGDSRLAAGSPAPAVDQASGLPPGATEGPALVWVGMVIAPLVHHII